MIFIVKLCFLCLTEFYGLTARQGKTTEEL